MLGEGMPWSLLLLIAMIGFIWGVFNDKEPKRSEKSEHSNGL